MRDVSRPASRATPWKNNFCAWSSLPLFLRASVYHDWLGKKIISFGLEIYGVGRILYHDELDKYFLIYAIAYTFDRAVTNHGTGHVD